LTSTTLDPSGRNATTQYKYDSVGRQTCVIDALGQRTRTVYDTAGRAVYTIDALGNVQQAVYDATRRIVKGVEVSQVVQAIAYANALDAATVAGFGDVVTGAQVVAALSASTTDATSYSVRDGGGWERYTLTKVDANTWQVTAFIRDGAGNVNRQIVYDKFL